MRKKIKAGILLFIPLILIFISLSGIAQTPGEWTWMNGNNTPGSLGVFGVQGFPNAANTPPALYEPCEWKDNNGKFWLFGGLNTMAGNRYNALWKYDPVTNQWTWIKGPSGVNQPGVYGIKGVPSPANYPGARSHGTSSWTDLSGNLWLFGGNNPAGGLLNDLWKYDIATNQWTWMHGSNVAGAVAVVGVMGVAAPANTPSGHDEAVGSGVDNLGNLWLYGGRTNDGDNVWKYDVATNQWTWMKGSNTYNSAIVYGTQGISAPTNTPGGARWPHASWTDALGNLWFFGGNVTAFAGGYTNDLWKYTLATNEWTWIKGPNTQNNAGSYGVQCVSAITNNPPSRHETRARIKDECGNFWMFGGYSSTGSLNDLWYYNMSTNEWTWISGSNATNQAAIYGTKGVSAPANRPDAGAGGVAWIDNNGYIYIFGGLTGASNTFSNALFRYVPNNPSFSPIQANSTICVPCNGSATVNVTCGQANFSYTWSNGINTTNSTSNANTISGLCPGTYTVTVTSACNKSQTTTFNITGNNCTGTTVTATGSSVCPGVCATVTSSGTNGTSPYTYSWSNGSTTQNISPCPASTTTYTVTIKDGGGSTSTSTAVVTVHSAVTVLITPTNINCSGGIASASASGGSGTSPYTYNWSNGVSGSAAPGLTAGIYTVTLTDNKGCTSTSTTTISSPLPLSGQFTKGTANCSACGCKEWLMINATGGTSPYSYSWPDGYSNRYKNHLCPGTYNINIVDKNGCSINVNLTTP